MKLLNESLDLTYCLNIHPGETWADTFHAIRIYPAAVRDRVAAGRRFGLGLRLSNQAAHELEADPGGLAEFTRHLAEQNLYVFTINGFPFGTFHDTAVKTRVYAPDWQDSNRVTYTCRLADLLAALLSPGAEGSISTVPVSYRSWVSQTGQRDTAIRNLVRTAAHLDAVYRRTGRRVRLALEPEPDCVLETTEEVLAFWADHLVPQGTLQLRQDLGLPAGEAEAIIRECVGVCFDTCHMALQFEDLATSLRRLGEAGIRVAKIQLSAALALRPTAEARRQLEAFNDPVYLHQVKALDAEGRRVGWPDLPEALRAAGAGRAADREWRVHVHVPLHYPGSGALSTTRSAMDRAFWAWVRRGACPHLEIETYTFRVLPATLAAGGVVESLAREYAWALESLAVPAGEEPGTSGYCGSVLR